MIDPVRQEVIALAHTVVVKVGTSSLTGAAARLDRPFISELAAQISRAWDAGFRVLLVTSGAITAGGLSPVFIKEERPYSRAAPRSNRSRRANYNRKCSKVGRWNCEVVPDS